MVCFLCLIWYEKWNQYVAALNIYKKSLKIQKKYPNSFNNEIFKTKKAISRLTRKIKNN